jgi:hypothetical protein
MVFLYSSSFAQDSARNTAAVSAAKISGKKFEVGVPVNVSLEFDAAQPWCGLEIQWGDGIEDTVRVGHESHNKFPLQLTHTYQVPGQFLLKIVGKNVMRGFKSANSCEGLPKQITITVESTQQKAEAERVRNEANQAKDDADRRSRELAEREADLRKREGKLEKDRQDQERRVQELIARQRAIENKSSLPPNTALPSQPPAANKKPAIDPF